MLVAVPEAWFQMTSFCPFIPGVDEKILFLIPFVVDGFDSLMAQPKLKELGGTSL
jgi:hypothetical protein